MGESHSGMGDNTLLISTRFTVRVTTVWVDSDGDENGMGFEFVVSEGYSLHNREAATRLSSVKLVIIIFEMLSGFELRRTSVNVDESWVATCTVDVLIDVVSGFGQNVATVVVVFASVVAVTTLASVRWRSIGLWPTFSNSSVSVSDSNPLEKQIKNV